MLCLIYLNKSCPRELISKVKKSSSNLKIQISADQIYFKIKYSIFSNDVKETTWPLGCHFGIARLTVVFICFTEGRHFNIVQVRVVTLASHSSGLSLYVFLSAILCFVAMLRWPSKNFYSTSSSNYFRLVYSRFLFICSKMRMLWQWSLTIFPKHPRSDGIIYPLKISV